MSKVRRGVKGLVQTVSSFINPTKIWAKRRVKEMKRMNTSISIMRNYNIPWRMKKSETMSEN